MNIEISETIARKVLTTVDAGLCSGLGRPAPGQMCVEAAVCFAMGLEHSDKPTCVSRALRCLKISLNDSKWSSNHARAKGLRRLALAQLGSADALDEREFTKRIVKLAIHKQVPAALRAAASVCKIAHKDKLMAMADLCEREPTREHAWAARSAAAVYAAVYAAAANAVNAVNAADAAVYAAAANAVNAADAAVYAAVYAVDAAVYAADAAVYAADAAADARDHSLAAFAEDVVQILVEMKAPGCQWLSLTEG